MVDPTNVKLLFRRSLLRASDSGVIEGISLRDLNACLIGFPPTYLQAYLSKEPNSFCSFRNSFASVMAALIFRRLRIIPGTSRGRRTSPLLYFATLAGAQQLHAFPY